MISEAIEKIQSMLIPFNLATDPMVYSFTGSNSSVQIIAFIDTSKINDELINKCRVMNTDATISLKFEDGVLNASDPQTFILKFLLDLEGCNNG